MAAAVAAAVALPAMPWRSELESPVIGTHFLHTSKALKRRCFASHASQLSPMRAQPKKWRIARACRHWYRTS